LYANSYVVTTYICRKKNSSIERLINAMLIHRTSRDIQAVNKLSKQGEETLWYQIH